MQKEPGARIQEPGGDAQKSHPLEGHPRRKMRLAIDSWILAPGSFCNFLNSFGRTCQVIPPKPVQPILEPGLGPMG